MEVNKIYNGDCLEVLKGFPDESVDMCITSPPYYNLRDYGVEGQLGLEPTFQGYISKLCDIFNEVKRVLKPSGTCWVNLGDCYSNSGKGGDSERAYAKRHIEFGKISDIRRHGKPTKIKSLPPKCLVQIPSRFAIEMTNRGWILRNELIWFKPNCMPSSVKDRFTVDFEKLFFFTKNGKYYFEQQFEQVQQCSIERLGRAVSNKNKWVNGADGQTKHNLSQPRPKQSKTSKTAEFFIQKGSGGNINLPQPPNINGRNKRCVWKISTKSFSEAHFAVFPPELIETPIKAGCPHNGIVLDPFMGAGTTAVVAKLLNRDYVGIELNSEYISIAEKRIQMTPEYQFELL